MRKGTDIIGKAVVDFATGDRFEKVEDIVFDPIASKVVAFLLDEGGWFSSAKVLPLDKVRAIGPDAILVDTKTVVVSAEQVPNLKDVLEHGNVLKGRRIMTTEGEDLGSASDLFFDEKTGMVEGYEVSGGLFADAYTGRSFVPAGETLKLGEDVAFVTPMTSQLMEEQVGGIKAGLQTAGEKVQEAGSATGEKLQEFGEKAGEFADQARTSMTGAVVGPDQEREYVVGKTADKDVVTSDGLVVVRQGEQVTPELAAAAEEGGVLSDLYRATGGTVGEGIQARTSTMAAKPVAEQARGRRARKTVRVYDGTIIVAEGQIVNDSVLARARAFNKEADLLNAVGLDTGEAAGTAARGMAGTTTEQVRGSAAEAGQTLSNGWARLTQSISGMQDRAAADREMSRINDALGRPVTRVILDQNDDVILNTGEIITHRAVALAKESGALDMLLDSVYKGEPPIKPEQMVAPESGEASLGENQQSEYPQQPGGYPQ